jgi:hypothetical protein
MASISEYSNITIHQIKDLDNFWKNQNLTVKNDIFSEKRNEFFKLKNQNPSAEISALEMASFYNAISNFHNLKEKGMKKNKTFSTSEIKKYEDFIIKSSHKPSKVSKKENFLLDKSSIVQNLIAENRSFREMSNFFKKYHRIAISHTYIKQIIEKYPNIFDKNKGENNDQTSC